jgi:hypothetical protein
MTLEAELLIKKGWVERTEAAKSSVDIDRGGLTRNKVEILGVQTFKEVSPFSNAYRYHFNLSED